MKSHSARNDRRNDRTKMFSVGEVNSSEVVDRTFGTEMKKRQ